MSKIVVSARPAKGYFGHGRFWGLAPCELEIVEEPAAEKVEAGDTFEQRLAKQKLREGRIASNRVTAAEVERIKADTHLAEAVIPSSNRTAELEAQLADRDRRITELEAQLAEATAPKKAKA